MMQDASSLDRLNDIVLPPDVSWWPLAVGWYFAIGILVLVASWLGWRLVKNWQANAYRRLALRELSNLQDAASIAELLRRTALVVTPRSEIASSTGSEWVDWLANQCSIAVPAEVRHQLSRGVYEPESEAIEIEVLRDYAGKWISGHQKISVET